MIEKAKKFFVISHNYRRTILCRFCVLCVLKQITNTINYPPLTQLLLSYNLYSAYTDKVFNQNSHQVTWERQQNDVGDTPSPPMMTSNTMGTVQGA